MKTKKRVRLLFAMILIIVVSTSIVAVKLYNDVTNGIGEAAFKTIETTHKISKEWKSKDLDPIDSLKQRVIKVIDSTQEKAVKEEYQDSLSLSKNDVQN